MPPIVFVLAALALLILLLTALLARKEASLMAGGIIAAFLLLGQFLLLRFAGTGPIVEFQPDWILLVADAALSFLLVLAYFTFVTVKSIRGHGEELESPPPIAETPAAAGPAGHPPVEARTVHPVIAPVLFAVMLTVALLATPQARPLEPWSWSLPDRELWGKVLLFPAGLLGLLGQLFQDAHNELAASVFAGILATWSYVIYVLLLWGMMRSRKWSILLMVACVLTGILLFNIVGCRLMLQDMGAIP